MSDIRHTLAIQSGGPPLKQGVKHIMKKDYQERKNARIEGYKEKAKKEEKKAETFFKQARGISEHIPPGQPILVGHHSEKRHRSDLKKIDSKMRKSIEADEKAEYYAQKAEAAESNTAISSDDPEAIKKVKEQIATLEERQQFMKQVNKFIKANDKDAFLKLKGMSVEHWEKLNKGDFCGRKGFADYTLKNNNANIRRLKGRLTQLEAFAKAENTEKTIHGVRVVLNYEANRLQLFFPSIPVQECRKELSKRGFKWSRTEGAWQRHISRDAIYWAKDVIGRYCSDAAR